MKKVLAVILSLIVVCGITTTTTAGADVDTGILAIQEVIKWIFDDEGYSSLFEKESFFITQNDSGDTIVIDVTVTPLLGESGRGSSTNAEAVSNVWNAFASTSSRYTDADVFFCLYYNDEVVYFATAAGVIDVQYSMAFKHPKK